MSFGSFSYKRLSSERGFREVRGGSARYPGFVPRFPWVAFRSLVVASLSLVALSACTPDAPPRWAEGGAPLAIAPARWERKGDDTVELMADGRVLEGGTLRFVIDRVGRITDDDYEAFALIEPDGHVVGTDARPLGYVGMSNASPPFGDQAWLSLQKDGTVLFFEPSGDRSNYGKWTAGCAGASRRVCTLVTQLFVVRNFRTAPAGPRFGIGVGVGMGF